MWIWLVIAYILLIVGLDVEGTLARFAIFTLAAAAYRYWDSSRTCKHCKRKAH